MLMARGSKPLCYGYAKLVVGYKIVGHDQLVGDSRGQTMRPHFRARSPGKVAGLTPNSASLSSWRGPSALVRRSEGEFTKPVAMPCHAVHTQREPY